MAALLGVERGSAAAPRQPALVNASRRVLRSTTAFCRSLQNGPSVHRHTRTLSNASSNRTDGPWGTPQGVGAVHRTSRRSRRETPVPAQNWQAALPKRWPSVRAHSRLEVQGCPSTRLGPQRRHSSKPRRQRLPIASEAARRRSNCARQPARGRGG